ncbi:hypothetical protein [Sphingosinicella sp.]|uniref:hypothetical protein n=1 Tax=Sphingosinicella sp. TaxID=1917971 RepID=UPI004037C1BC
MTGISLEPKVGSRVAAGMSADASSPAASDSIGFAAMLANLSRSGGAEGDEAESLWDLFAVLLDATGDLGQGAAVGKVGGFLGGHEGDQAPLATAQRSLAAIFNEFGLFGGPIRSPSETIEGSCAVRAMAAAAQTVEAAATPPDARGKGLSNEGEATAGGRGGNSRLTLGEETFWSGPAREYLGTSPTSFPGASSNPRVSRSTIATPATATPFPAISWPSIPLRNVSQTAEPPFFEHHDGPRYQPSQIGGGNLGTRVSLTIVEQTASLVARIERLSREDRLKLRLEAERLLAAYGFVSSEIRVNGAIDNDRSS